MKALIGIVLLILALSIFGVVIVRSIQLRQNCTGYLKRAADANTVENAKEQLSIAISYLEAHNLISGYTSVLWKTPDEDIGFWYNNLKTSYEELSKVDSTTSALEKSNILMKLRETLIDNGEKGDSMTIPNGLSRYPHNLLFGVLMWIGFFVLIGGIIWIVMISTGDF